MEDEGGYFALADISAELKAFSDVRTEQIMINKIKGLQTEMEAMLKSKIRAKKETIHNATETEKRVSAQQQQLEEQEAALTEKVREQIALLKEGLGQISSNDEAFRAQFNRVNTFYSQLENSLVAKNAELQAAREGLAELKSVLRLLVNCTRARVSEDGKEALLFEDDSKLRKHTIGRVSPRKRVLELWQEKAKLALQD